LTNVNLNGIVDMSKGKRKRKKVFRPTSHYKLSEVIQKINNGQVRIRRNAEDKAYKQFGWGLPDIKNAYKKLRSRHFDKTDVSDYKEGVALDFYKATIYGEKIYTHFYIDDKSGFLIINSFHEQ